MMINKYNIKQSAAMKHWRSLLCVAVLFFMSAANFTADAQYNNLWARWAKKTGFAGPEGTSKARDVISDAAGNVYVSGIFTGKVNFSGDACNPAYVDIGTDQGAYIVKFDADGNFKWRSFWRIDNRTGYASDNYELVIKTIAVPNYDKLGVVVATNAKIVASACPNTLYGFSGTNSNVINSTGANNVANASMAWNSECAESCTTAGNYVGVGGFFLMDSNTGSFGYFHKDQCLTEGNLLRTKPGSNNVYRSFFRFYKTGVDQTSGRNTYTQVYDAGNGNKLKGTGGNAVTNAGQGYSLFRAWNDPVVARRTVGVGWKDYNSCWNQEYAANGTVHCAFFRSESTTSKWTTILAKAADDNFSSYSQPITLGFDNEDTPLPLMTSDASSNLYVAATIKHVNTTISSFGSQHSFTSPVGYNKAVIMGLSELDYDCLFAIQLSNSDPGSGLTHGNVSDNSKSAITDLQHRGGFLYVTGNFQGTINFNPKGGDKMSRTSSGSGSDGFYAVYNLSGICQKVIVFNGNATESISGLGFSTTENRVLLAGHYNGASYQVDPFGDFSNASATRFPALVGTALTAQTWVGKYCVTGPCPTPMNMSYGDAPSSYGVAANKVVSCVRLNGLDLGKLQTSPEHSVNANTADNDDGISITTAEYGYIDLTSGNFLRSGNDFRLNNIRWVNSSSVIQSATLRAWIDLNCNGKFEPEESSTIVTDVPSFGSSGVSSGITSLYWTGGYSTLKANESALVSNGNITYLRIRITYDALNAADAAGLLESGEVEDYAIKIRLTAPTITANNNYYSTTSGVKIWNKDILTNDNLDPYSPSATTVVNISGTSNYGGIIELNADKTINYNPPNPTWNGVDYVDYTVTCTEGGLSSTTNTARVYFIVQTPINPTVCVNGTAYPQMVEIDEGTLGYVIYKWYTASTGGTSYSIGNQSSGLAVGNSVVGTDIPALRRYAEANYYDQGGALKAIFPRVMVTVSVERCIQTNPDVAVASFESPVTISVLTNDVVNAEAGYTVPNGAVSYVSGADLTKGTITVNSNNTITYQPVNGFHGTHTFTYRLTVPDGLGGNKTSENTVTVTVIDAIDDTYSMPLGGSKDLHVLINDMLYGKDVTSVEVVGTPSGPAGGDVSLFDSGATDAEGKFVYTPTAVGTYTFNYRVTIEGGVTTDATVTITVTDVEANPDYVISDKPGDPIDINILGNDNIPDDVKEHVEIKIPDGEGGNNLKDPTHGTVTPGTDDEGNPILVYTPDDPDWTGVDEFEYEVEVPVDPEDPDGEKVKDKTTVYVVIIDPCDDRVCEGSSATVKANPTNITGVSFYWFDVAANGNVLPEDATHVNSLAVTRSGYGVENRWAEVSLTTSEGVHTFTGRYQVKAAFVPNLMYWKQDASDNDWNNPDNWVTRDGTSFGFDCVPWKCTVVHIPGNAKNYPSLNPESTDWATHVELFYHQTAPNVGQPCCSDIIYHFGGEVAKPHYLDYDRAFVHYNFGAYETVPGAADEDGSETVNKDKHETVADHVWSAIHLSRGRYYAMAAPLKQIVTGDFSVGGYPKLWQQGFKTSRNEEPDLNPDDQTGLWYLPNNKMSLEIGAEMNYAIALKAFGYNGNTAIPETVGMRDHKNLNALNGIIELPYFEDPAELVKPSVSGGIESSTPHRLHWFTPSGTGVGTSNFMYYYDSSLKLALTYPADTYGRDQKAYRFVFENGSNEAEVEFPITVPADGSNVDVMVGNPFISSLDFNEFYTANSAKIIGEEYRLYDNGSFNTYTEGITPGYGIIAPLQAFFVRPTAGSNNEQPLIFTKEMSVTRGESVPHQLKSSTNTVGVLTINASNSVGETQALIAFGNPKSRNNTVRLFSNDVPEKPQVYLVDDNQKIEIMYLDDPSQPITIPLGIYSSAKGKFELRFDNLANLPVTSLILLDKERYGQEINLLADGAHIYKFENINGNLANRFDLIIGRQDTPTDVTPVGPASVKIYTKEQVLCVDANKAISEVQVSTTSGYKILSETASGNYQFRKGLNVVPGVYIVTVKLSDGETKIGKIIIR